MNILCWPAIYALELTPACNNHCIGCSNVYASERVQPPMSAAAWVSLLDTFAPEAVQIRLTGGEPTLHPEFLSILEAATSYDAVVTVFTNGRWRNPKLLVEQLHGQSNFSGLLVSLHGARSDSHEAFSRVPGSFDEATNNIRLAVDNGIMVALSTIITHESWDEIEAVLELGRRLGVQHIAFNRYIGQPLPEIEPTPSEIQSAVTIIESLIRAGAPVKYGIGMPQCFESNSSEGCLAGVAYVSIDPWGNVRPCAHSPTIIGSLHQSSLPELWCSAAMDAWRALMPSDCVPCMAYTICHGGCRAVQELRSDRRDPLRGLARVDYSPIPRVRELPADVRPHAVVRLRPESFGYSVLGRGHVLPVRTEAREVIEACDGSATFAELATRLDQSAVELLGDLWEMGMLEVE